MSAHSSAEAESEGLDSKHSAPADRPLILGLMAILVVYGVALPMGWLTPAESGHQSEVHAKGAIAHAGSVLPFVLLLGAIAVFPLLGATAHWWEHNRNKLFVSAGLALATLAYLAVGHPAGSVGHAAHTLVHTILEEYIPFIILLFALYTISGGIRIAGDLEATPRVNTLFMLAGGVLASFIGTTGAAMLLIRPLLETNRERKQVAHTVVFFIFVVCNCGGLLLPIGDPPLFLGYLKGVPFLWTMHLVREWLFVNGMLLAVYFAWDTLVAHPRETKADLAKDVSRTHRLRFAGVWPNLPLLVGVILAVALLVPEKPLLGTNWIVPFYLREAVQLGLVLCSIGLGATHIRKENNFSYGAIVEVACLFIGIFICMQPALEILNARGASLGLDTPHEFFWASGSLSSVLDNAPTYLVFFNTATALPGEGVRVAGVDESLLTAISLGAVMMGAMTYIGNGPNFMVKTIAEGSGVKMPSFFGYMLYSFGVLLPILALQVWLFL